MDINQFDNRRPPVFMRPGHCAGDLLEASKWKVIKEQHGLVELDVHLPSRLLNPRGQLFGGFTGTYVDMAAIYTVRTLYLDKPGFTWTSTVNMRIDYLDPVMCSRFRLRGELIKDGKRTCLVSVCFLDEHGEKLVYALCTMRKHESVLNEKGTAE